MNKTGPPLVNCEKFGSDVAVGCSWFVSSICLTGSIFMDKLIGDGRMGYANRGDNFLPRG